MTRDACPSIGSVSSLSSMPLPPVHRIGSGSASTMMTSLNTEDVGPSTGPVSSLSSILLPLAHLNCSNFRIIRTTGLSLPNRVAMVAWYRGKARISRLLSNPPSKTHIIYEATCRLPSKIVESILAHLTYDLDTLKRCSLTCRSWYIIAVPHIHHTLILKDKVLDTVDCKLKLLSRLHKLGLTHLVKEIRVGQLAGPNGWFGPQAFRPNDHIQFCTFKNVHTLRIQGLNIDRFMPGVEYYFYQFSPTLRSISLYYPTCRSPRHLPYFLSLFPNLDNVEIRQFFTSNLPIPDNELSLFSSPTFRGQLTLHDFSSTEAWAYLLSVSAGLRFRDMVLRKVGACAPMLLKACAKTLETVRFYVTDVPG
jgi:hypothetical protein